MYDILYIRSHDNRIAYILPPNKSGAFDRELLEKAVTMFRRKSCKAVNESKLYAKHRKEDLETARIHLLARMVLDRLSMESCWLFISSSSCCLRALCMLWLNRPLTRPPFIRLQKIQIWGALRVRRAGIGPIPHVCAVLQLISCFIFRSQASTPDF